jgi:hypothetical protein
MSLFLSHFWSDSLGSLHIKHEVYKAGDDCPLECGGKLYNIEPGIVMRIYGQSEADVVKYEVEKLRCSSCLKVFSANLILRNGI